MRNQKVISFLSGYLNMTKNNNKGISVLGILILGAILLLVLSYFGISIKSVVQSPTSQENISYIRGAGNSLWDDYLKKPAEYIWNDVFKKILWESFISNMEKIKNNEPTDLEKMAPVVPTQGVN